MSHIIKSDFSRRFIIWTLDRKSRAKLFALCWQEIHCNWNNLVDIANFIVTELLLGNNLLNFAKEWGVELLLPWEIAPKIYFLTLKNFILLLPLFLVIFVLDIYLCFLFFDKSIEVFEVEVNFFLECLYKIFENLIEGCVVNSWNIGWWVFHIILVTSRLLNSHWQMFDFELQSVYQLRLFLRNLDVHD